MLTSPKVHLGGNVQSPESDQTPESRFQIENEGEPSDAFGFAVPKKSPFENEATTQSQVGDKADRKQDDWFSLSQVQSHCAAR